MSEDTWASSPVSGSVSGDTRRAWLLKVASPVSCQMSFGVSGPRLCCAAFAHVACARGEISCRQGLSNLLSGHLAGDVISTDKRMVVVIFSSSSSSRGLQGCKSVQRAQVMKSGPLRTSDWYFMDVVDPSQTGVDYI